MKDGTMANDHKHGEMDIKVQEKTFDGFIKASVYVAVGSILFLVFLAIVNG